MALRWEVRKGNGRYCGPSCAWKANFLKTPLRGEQNPRFIACNPERRYDPRVERSRTRDEWAVLNRAEIFAWESMLQRCLKPSSQGFKNYGGRGITVCDRWRNSFYNFLVDMGNRPGPEYSLDRQNNDGNYEPGNCRWATKKEQARNRRSNHYIAIDGVNKTITEWASQSRMSVSTLSKRIADGLEPAVAISFPAGPTGFQKTLKRYPDRLPVSKVGQPSTRRKFTAEQVLMIRQAYDLGSAGCHSIGHAFGASSHTIYDIVTHRTYRDLSAPISTPNESGCSL